MFANFTQHFIQLFSFFYFQIKLCFVWKRAILFPCCKCIPSCTCCQPVVMDMSTQTIPISKMFTPDRPVVCCSSCPRGSSKSNIMDVVVHMLNCVGLVKNNKYYTGGTVLKFIRKSIESGNLIPLTHTYMTTQLTGLVRTDTLIKLAGLITI